MDNTKIEKLNNIILYTVIYTISFIIISAIMPYMLPFLMGIIIALIANPLVNIITNKFKIKREIVGIIIVLLIFAVSSITFTLVITKIINELISLSTNLSHFIVKIKDKGYQLIDKASLYYHAIDPSISNSIKGLTNQVFSGSFTLVVYILNHLLNIVKSLPGLLMLILFTLLSSIYFVIDFPKIKRSVFLIFSEESSSKIKNILYHSYSMILNYLRAYLILISITFVEVFIGTSLIGIKYSLLLSLITSISDALPVFGPGTILIPTGIGYILSGLYVKGIEVIILYLVITIVRQILEPKIVSSSLGIYPLVIIAAIFIGLKAHGFIGMIFTVFYVVFYVILKRVDVLK